MCVCVCVLASVLKIDHLPCFVLVCVWVCDCVTVCVCVLASV